MTGITLFVETWCCWNYVQATHIGYSKRGLYSWQCLCPAIRPLGMLSTTSLSIFYGTIFNIRNCLIRETSGSTGRPTARTMYSCRQQLHAYAAPMKVMLTRSSTNSTPIWARQDPRMHGPSRRRPCYPRICPMPGLYLTVRRTICTRGSIADVLMFRRTHGASREAEAASQQDIQHALPFRNNNYPW